MGFFSALVGGVVGFLIGGPVGAVIGAGLGATKVGEKVVNSVMDFVLQPFMPSIPDMGNNEAASQREQGVLIQRQGSTSQIPVVYGYRKLGTAVAFAETGSASNKYLYVAYVLSEGTIEGLREVYIDDWQLPVDQVGALNGGSLVTVNADRYKDRVQLRFFPGVFFANPRSSTVGTIVKGDIFAESPSFSSDMVYNGLAVIFARYEWRVIANQVDADANPFSGNIPELSAGILGKRVASLLVDTTETQEYDTNSVRYSTNPAECLLDYLRNPRYGKGLVNADIDYTTFKAAARKCNQTVTYLATQSIQGPILTLNMVVNTDTSLMSNVKVMLQNFRAYMPYVQGKYKLRIEDAGNDTDILSGVATIVQTLTKDDIVSDVTFTGIDRSSKYNVVAVTYVDPDQKFSNQTVIYPETEAERQVYISRDGNRENKYETTLGGITNYAIAKDFARLIFNKQRRQESCVFTATSKALELEPGDCIRINSNILNFGTDPWRVVSVKINNDMTVDLGCVRNPDDIYPYTRVGEEDIVIPTYVPKGSIIYFPSSFNPNPLGLVPPTNAVFPVTITPVISNPPATNPNGTTGGGVGGGTPGGGTAGPITAPPTVPVPPVNVPPVAPPPPPPFQAALSVKRSQAVRISTGNYNISTVFAQPQDGLYSYSILWWRYSRQSPWTEVRLDTLPGAGGDIPWNLNNIGFGYYEFYARSFATDGRPSTFVFTGQVEFPPNEAELNPNLTGLTEGGARQVVDGWQLPQSELPPAARYNDVIDFLELRPKLTSGAPQNPRRITAIVNQNTFTATNTPNFGIRGVIVYYKFSTDQYYESQEFVFNTVTNYTFGTQVSFDLTGDFGAPGTGNALALYDFVIRLTYTDGTAATKQIGPVQVNVEEFIGLKNFVIVGTGGGGNLQTDTISARVKSLDIPQGFSLQTTPPGFVSDAAGVIPYIKNIVSGRTQPTLRFEFERPVNSRWRGYKIRYRAVVAGTNQPFTTQETGFAVNEYNRVVSTITGGAFSFNRTYDWVITAQYSGAGGAILDATTSLVCRASILDFHSAYYNSEPGLLNNVMILVEQLTSTALAGLRATFPATPTPDPKNWIKNSGTRRDVYDATQLTVQRVGQGGGVGAPDAVRTPPVVAGGTYTLNVYYTFKFQMPNDTFEQLVIHRRLYDTVGASKTSVTGTAKYYGLGRWEKININRAFLTKGSDGFYTVNVRGPLDYFLFNIYYEARAGQTLIQPHYDTGSYPNNTEANKITGIFPYAGAGNTQWSYANGTSWNEWLFSIKDLGVESDKAIRVKDFYTADGYSNTDFKTQVDGLATGNISKDDIVNISDFNTFEAGYARNINEAITTYINTQFLSIGDSNLGAGWYPPSKVPNCLNFTGAANRRLITPSGIAIY